MEANEASELVLCACIYPKCERSALGMGASEYCRQSIAVKAALQKPWRTAALRSSASTRAGSPYTEKPKSPGQVRAGHQLNLLEWRRENDAKMRKFEDTPALSRQAIAGAVQAME